MKSNESHIGRLLKEIDLQYHAAQLALSGLALGTSMHEFISARMERIGMARDELAEMVGDEDEATRLVVEQMDRSSK